MTNSAYLLDTNAAIAYIDGDKRLETTLNEAEEPYTSVVVLGELYYGAENSLRIQENLAQVEKFAANVRVLGVDMAVARHFGKVNRQLRVKGRPIQSNDIWIAATAIQHDLTLLTRDTDFNAVGGLTVQSW